MLLMLLIALIGIGNVLVVSASYYDPCGSNPCQNNALCLDVGFGPSGYYCLCPLNYYGVNCESATNFACETRHPCQNLATCSDLGGDDYYCYCQNGYRGKDCEIPPPECIVDNPCASGVCACAGEPSTYYGVDCRGDMVCYCYPDRNGTLCDQVVPCPEDPAYNPCKNNGTCNANGDNYSCDCTGTGFDGPTCEQPDAKRSTTTEDEIVTTPKNEAQQKRRAWWARKAEEIKKRLEESNNINL